DRRGGDEPGDRAVRGAGGAEPRRNAFAGRAEAPAADVLPIAGQHPADVRSPDVLGSGEGVPGAVGVDLGVAGEGCGSPREPEPDLEPGGDEVAQGRLQGVLAGGDRLGGVVLAPDGQGEPAGA